MKNPKLAGRYAYALYEFAQEKQQLETVYQDFILIKQVVEDNRELQVVIESPVIYPDKKNDIFNALFAGKVNEISLLFLSLIIRKKREPALLTICDEFKKIYYDFHHIKVATVTTAYPVDKLLLDKLKVVLEEQTHYTVETANVVDPNILGGLIVKMDDFVFDDSIVAKVNKLKNEFAHNIYQANF